MCIDNYTFSTAGMNKLKKKKKCNINGFCMQFFALQPLFFFRQLVSVHKIYNLPVFTTCHYDHANGSWISGWMTLVSTSLLFAVWIVFFSLVIQVVPADLLNLISQLLPILIHFW